MFLTRREAITDPSGERVYFKSHNGYFGEFGGCFIPEILHNTLSQLRDHYDKARKDESFWQAYLDLLHEYSGRPTPLTFCPHLTEHFGGAKIFLKREDLNHSGAHKINNVLGQGLLTKRMGKPRVIAETGAGQHGMATAIMAARFGFRCRIFMGAKDIDRQFPNVFWMKKLGAEVVGVEHGGATLKDAIDETLRDWAQSFEDTHYVMGTVCGPHPFPEMVAWFQSVIGDEARRQALQQIGHLPKAVYACVGGGSNACGIFGAFVGDKETRLVGVEAGGRGLSTGQHAARLSSNDGATGVTQGYKTRFLQNQDGQMRDTSSIAAGLDYTGISPILADLWQQGRLEAATATDEEVVATLRLVIAKEGLIPALESTHAFCQAFKDAPKMGKSDAIIINMSGRGDKDIFAIADAFDDKEFRAYLKQRSAPTGERP